MQNGLCHLFLRHTSASLLITENADPDVRRDPGYSLCEFRGDGHARVGAASAAIGGIPDNNRSCRRSYSV